MGWKTKKITKHLCNFKEAIRIFIIEKLYKNSYSCKELKKYKSWWMCCLWYNGPSRPLALRFASLEHHASFLGIETTIANAVVVIRYNFIIATGNVQLLPAFSANQLDILTQVYKERTETQVHSLPRYICDTRFLQLEKLYFYSHCFCFRQRHRKRELVYTL